MKEPGIDSSHAVQMCLQLIVLITSDVGTQVWSVKVLMSKAISAPFTIVTIPQFTDSGYVWLTIVIWERSLVSFLLHQ